MTIFLKIAAYVIEYLNISRNTCMETRQGKYLEVME